MDANTAAFFNLVRWKVVEVIEESTHDASHGRIWADIVDCDVHNNVPSMKALHPYLTDRWRDYVIESGRVRGHRPEIHRARIWISCAISYSIRGTSSKPSSTAFTGSR